MPRLLILILAVAVEDLARLASGRTILSTKPGPSAPFNPDLPPPENESSANVSV